MNTTTPPLRTRARDHLHAMAADAALPMLYAGLFVGGPMTIYHISSTPVESVPRDASASQITAGVVANLDLALAPLILLAFLLPGVACTEAKRRWERRPTPVHMRDSEWDLPVPDWMALGAAGLVMALAGYYAGAAAVAIGSPLAVVTGYMTQALGVLSGALAVLMALVMRVTDGESG